MGNPAKFYDAIGGAAGCLAIATAFYAHVARDPVLRPLFPSTFRCAIEQFSAFLVQFPGGDSVAMQSRWWLSLRESHDRFPLGERERTAWLRAMSRTLDDESLIADSGVRRELLEFFRLSSAYVVNRGPAPAIGQPLHGELAPLWDQQLALDEVVVLLRSPASAERCLALLRSPVLQVRFEKSPSVHASVLSLTAQSAKPLLRRYAFDQLRANPALVHARYKHSRTLLHDAASSGDLDLVELLLDLGAGQSATDDPASRSPLYCVGNECTAPVPAGLCELSCKEPPSR